MFCPGLHFKGKTKDQDAIYMENFVHIVTYTRKSFSQYYSFGQPEFM